MLSDRQPDGVSKQGPRCGVERLFEVLPQGEIDALNAMFEDRRWTDPAIYDACRAEKYVVPRWAIPHHRRKRCRCFNTP